MGIIIDFSTGITVLLSIPLALVFSKWAFYNYIKEEEWDYQSDYFHQCPYCTYIFFDYKNNPLKMCPRCYSLIAKAKESE